MNKIKLRVKQTVTMQPIFGKTAIQLFDEFINIARKEVMSLDNKQLSNKVFNKFFQSFDFSHIRNHLKTAENKLQNKKTLYDLFHSIFRNYRWASESGNEKEIEIKVWISSSIDRIERVLKILEKNNERN